MQNSYNSEKPKTNIKMEKMNEIVTFWIPLYGIFRKLSAGMLLGSLLFLAMLLGFVKSFFEDSTGVEDAISYGLFTITILCFLLGAIRCILRRGKIGFDGNTLRLDYYGMSEHISEQFMREEISMVMHVGKIVSERGPGQKNSTVESAFSKLVIIFNDGNRPPLMLMIGWRAKEIQWIAANLRDAMDMREPTKKEFRKARDFANLHHSPTVD